MINNQTLRLVPLALALALLSLSACRREAKAPPGPSRWTASLFKPTPSA